MASILVILGSSPETATGRGALALAGSLVDQGHILTLGCLQDAVLLASTRASGAARAALDSLLDRGARCVVLREDLLLRGLQGAERAREVDHAGLVEALAAGHDRIIGAL